MNLSKNLTQFKDKFTKFISDKNINKNKPNWFFSSTFYTMIQQSNYTKTNRQLVGYFIHFYTKSKEIHLNQ